MNKHELFDLIGEADEDYVLAADQPVKRARPRWQTWAACAACAALVIGAYPLYNTLRPQEPALHGYTVVEGANSINGVTERNTIKAPFTGGEGEPAPIPDPTDPLRGSGPDAAPSGDMGPEDGANYDAPADAPVDKAPYDQYNNLFENAHLEQYPEWYGGAYIDCTTLGEPSELVVCIVDGFHTTELEQQIAEWCGEGVWAYRDVKYSRGYLQELMERLNDSQFLTVVEADKAISGWGVYEEGNCIRMDCRDIPSDATLAALAEFDPDGDAIQVRVIAGQTVNTDIVKGPAPDKPAADPITPEARATPIVPIDGSCDDARLPGAAQEGGAREVPGGAQIGQPADESEKTLPDGEETGVPAQYDKYDTLPTVANALPTMAEELPEAK